MIVFDGFKDLPAELLAELTTTRSDSEIKNLADKYINDFISNIEKQIGSKILSDLWTEFNRYKCYENARIYLWEYAKSHGVVLKDKREV